MAQWFYVHSETITIAKLIDRYIALLTVVILFRQIFLTYKIEYSIFFFLQKAFYNPSWLQVCYVAEMTLNSRSSDLQLPSSKIGRWKSSHPATTIPYSRLLGLTHPTKLQLQTLDYFLIFFIPQPLDSTAPLTPMIQILQIPYIMKSHSICHELVQLM